MIGAKNTLRPAFTLMEVLVALTLFAVVLTIATDLFLTFQRVSRKTENLEVMVANARFTLERIAREIREGNIDYARYRAENLNLSGAAVPALYLRTSTEGTTGFIFSDCRSELLGRDCLELINGANREAVTSLRIRLREVNFFIVPTEDPVAFIAEQNQPRSGQYGADLQPRVTVFLSFDNGLNDDRRDYTRYDVQTTISSKVYTR